MHDTTHPRTRDRGAVISDGTARLAQWSLRLLLIAVGAALCGWLVGRLWVGLLPVILALIVATVLWPLTAWLRRHRVPSALAAVTVLLGSLVVFLGVIGAIIPTVVSQSGELADSAAQGLTRLQDRVAQAPFNIDSRTIDEGVGKATDWLQAQGGQIASGAMAGASAVGSGVVTLVLVLVLVFFFLKDGPDFLPFVRRTAGERAGDHLTEVCTRAWNTLGGFVRTQAIVALVDAVLIGVGLLLLGVPLAFALAVLTFFGAFIPIIGAFAAGALAVLVALVANGPMTALFVLALVVAVQQIEGNVLQPFLQGRSMDLHAGIILLAVTVGSTIFGIVGAFLAVPVAAVGAVVVRYLSEQANLRSGSVAAADVATDTDEGRRAAERAEHRALEERARVEEASRAALATAPGSRATSPERPGLLSGIIDRLLG